MFLTAFSDILTRQYIFYQYLLHTIEIGKVYRLRISVLKFHTSETKKDNASVSKKKLYTI